jgi:hypothetical protein
MPYFVESLLNVKENASTYFLSFFLSFFLSMLSFTSILLTILWHCWIVEWLAEITFRVTRTKKGFITAALRHELSMSTRHNWVKGLNSTRGTGVCVRLFSFCCPTCRQRPCNELGPMRGALPTMLGITNLKKRSRLNRRAVEPLIN